MPFTSTWSEVVGDIEGITIDTQAGTHDPPWDEMNDGVKSLVQEAASCAERVVEDLASEKEGEVTYHVKAWGSYNHGNFNLSVKEAE